MTDPIDEVEQGASDEGRPDVPVIDAPDPEPEDDEA